MSSLNSNKPFNNDVSEKQFNGYFVPAHNAKVIKAGIKNGTAPFLPDQTGKIDAKAIYNGNTGFCLNAKDLLPLQVENGDKSNVVVTFKTVNAAGTQVKEGEKGFFYNYVKDKETNTIGTSQFFFPEQTANPEAVAKAVEEKVKKNGERKLDKTIEITSAEPEEYLGAYIAACKSGATVTASPKVAKAFIEKFTEVLNNQLSKPADRKEGVDKYSELMFKVDTKANAINQKLYAEVKQEHQQKQEQGKKKEQGIERS
ncbi:ArdC-like ssDNA-binding domain-containing protein [Treponema sp. Marseille-Q3903]|uniref:ArdC-like ssDNA-binding domain-containing protein n=1 Tax=Treponema sp. Marseille-Q3903 TaxID=2766703 RepID=UPI0016528CD1|nr:ArdC-like ssDNA-binding domain-containing protein [Treponema sp. Marseille-Q3903]MBC6713586.1 hypothetical protein [Treponema sp. Marseille-Q3903]